MQLLELPFAACEIPREVAQLRALAQGCWLPLLRAPECRNLGDGVHRNDHLLGTLSGIADAGIAWHTAPGPLTSELVSQSRQQFIQPNCGFVEAETRYCLRQCVIEPAHVAGAPLGGRDDHGLVGPGIDT